MLDAERIETYSRIIDITLQETVLAIIFLLCVYILCAICNCTWGSVYYAVAAK